ncbi:MAG: hypothetical protein IJM81_01900 [Prevotella sp.]|nr:hypothetical protein [Prevotella sp.]
MKKLFLMALMAVAATNVFAGDSDALKAILKASTYAEASQLVNSTLSQLANDQEKAKAYNKLVELAMAKYDKEVATLQQNEVAKQLQGDKAKEQPVDMPGMYEAVYQAVTAAVECDKYDQKPDAKGKVKPRFAEANALKVWNARIQLVNAGNDASSAQNGKDVLKYWGTLLDSENAPLFAKQDRTQESEFIYQIADYTARWAYQEKDIERAKRYCDIAMKDPDAKKAKEAQTLKYIFMKESLTSREDSVKFVNDLKAEYEADPSNDEVFDMIFNIYGSLGEKDIQRKFVDDKLASDPNNYIALADKGLIAMNENNVEDAITYLKRALTVKDDDALIQTYLGTCYTVKAGNQETQQQAIPYFDEAIKAFDKAKQLDPNKQRANWGYNRYQAYYGRYGENDPKTKDAEYDK